MSQQNSPSWGAPAGAAWGSPAVDSRLGRNSPSSSFPGRNSPNNPQTPVHHAAHRNSPTGQFNNSRGGHSHRGGGTPYRLSNSNSSPSSFNYSPRHFQPRPRYQSSPMGTPNNNNSMRFGGQTNSNNSQYFTPSPRGRGNNNNSFNSHRKSFSQQRDRSSMSNNPGGSSNINDYIHPSMLEDPWKDLQPKQLLKQY